MSEWLWFWLVLFLSGAVQGITGFGFGMLAIALLALVIDVRTASSSIAVVGLCLNIAMFLKLRRDFRFERVWPMILATGLAAPVGILFLTRAPERLIICILGVVMMASFIHMKWPKKTKPKPWHPIYLGVPCGLAGGWVGGAFGAGGPPLVAFLMTQQFPLPRYIASLQLAFAVASCTRVIALSQTGFFSGPIIMQVMIGAVIAASGAILGYHVANRIPKRLLASGTIWFFGAIGVYYLIRGLL